MSRPQLLFTRIRNLNSVWPVVASDKPFDVTFTTCILFFPNQMKTIDFERNFLSDLEYISKDETLKHQERCLQSHPPSSGKHIKICQSISCTAQRDGNVREASTSTIRVFFFCLLSQEPFIFMPDVEGE